jgi:hypothetical protein
VDDIQWKAGSCGPFEERLLSGGCDVPRRGRCAPPRWRRIRFWDEVDIPKLECRFRRVIERRVGVGREYKNNDWPLTEHWDGAVWNIVPSPSLKGGSLYGVAAISSNDVWAVGQSGVYTFNSLIEHWDGTAWSIVSGPPTDQLYGVSSLASNDVWAVGVYGNNPVVQHWDGTTLSTVPSPTTKIGATLSGVDAISPTDIWAVGTSYGYVHSRTFIEHWEGTTWGIVPSPKLTDSELDDVAAVSSTDVWAVGVSTGSRNLKSLTEHWDGTTWSIVPSPNLSGAGRLYGVTIVNTDDVWAVGGDLIEHWEGTAWSLVPHLSERFSDITAVSATDIWAVGGPPFVRFPEFFEHWDGTVWTVVGTIIYQNTDVSLKYDGWRGDNTGFDVRTSRSSSTANETLSFPFNGTSITLVTHDGPAQGIAAVSIDGVDEGTVDLYAPSVFLPVDTVFGNLSSGSHQIVITVTGTKNANSTGARVTVDGFVNSSNVFIDASSPRLTYDRWRGHTSTSAKGGSYRVSPKAGSTVGLTFSGTSIRWITSTCPFCGVANVFVDGTFVRTVDLYGSTQTWRVVRSFKDLAPGIHTMKVLVTGTKDASSTGTTVVIDALISHG